MSDKAVGFVLITVIPTHEHAVYAALDRMRKEGVSDIHPLFGEYDIIARIEKPTMREVGDLVISKIRAVDGIVDTKTLTGTMF